MRVFVINMQQHAERRAAARRKLDAAGVPFEFFPGMSGEQALRLGLFRGVDEREFLLNTGRRVVPGEIGCFASHRELWKVAVELDEPIMVLEDDFDLLDWFADALTSACDVIRDVGYLRLQVDRAARRRHVFDLGEFSVSRYTKAPHCMMCYCISPAVAAHFIDRTRVVEAPVDVFVKKFWEHGQPIYALTPYAVAPSILSPKTTIAGREKRRKPLPLAARRFMRKGRWYWRRFLFNVRNVALRAEGPETVRPMSIGYN